MKNNKGYTLVELILSLGVFMIIFAEIMMFMRSSQRFYINGANEVKLQREAQQVIQQLEELLIDAQDNVSVNIAVSDNSLRAKAAPSSALSNLDNFKNVNIGESFSIYWSSPSATSNSVSYNFVLKEAYDYDEFGYLWMTKYVDGVAGSEQLLAEYVNNVQIDMNEFNTASRVCLSVSMNNGSKSYATNKDVYLRNDIGASMNRVSSGDEAAEWDLNVLRCKQYNLNKEFGIPYGYYDMSISGTAYSLTKVNNAAGAYYTVSANGVNNSKDAQGNVTIICTPTAANPDHDEKKITVHTDKLEIGLDNVAYYFPAYNTSCSYRKDYVYVKGVDVAAINKTKSTVTFNYAASGGMASDNIDITINAGPITPSSKHTGGDHGISYTKTFGNPLETGDTTLMFDSQDQLIIVMASAPGTEKVDFDSYYKFLYDKGYKNLHFHGHLQFMNYTNLNTDFDIWARPIYDMDKVWDGSKNVNTNSGFGTNYEKYYWLVTN